MDCFDNSGIGSGFGTGIVVPIVAQNQQINNLLQQGYQFIARKSFNDVNFETLTDTIRFGYRGCHTVEDLRAPLARLTNNMILKLKVISAPSAAGI